MKTRPILFSGPMVRALLAGTKTQTRRIVKPQIAEYVQATPDVHPTTRTAPYLDSYCGERKTPENPRGMSREWHWWTADNRLGPHVSRCPYGVPGDRLWVRETIRRDTDPLGDPMHSYCCADESVTVADAWPWKNDVLPSIHMPRSLSRITLEITGVRVERLNDISESDARAEGISKNQCPDWHAISDYRVLWESINGHGSWSDNPWVWGIEFRRVAP